MGFNLNLPFGQKKKKEDSLMGMKDDIVGGSDFDMGGGMDNTFPPSLTPPMQSPGPAPTPQPAQPFGFGGQAEPFGPQQPMDQGTFPQGPSQPSTQSQLPPDLDEKINELIEKYLEEKWQVVAQFLQDLKAWKNTVDDEIREIKEELTKLKARVDEIENGSQQKLNEVARTIMDLGAEIKAMERVLQQMLPDLVSSVRELSKIVSELKSLHEEKL